MGMLSHVMYTAHLPMCSLTLITLYPSFSCMLLALPAYHPAVLNVYTAQLPRAVTLYLSSCSPFCLHSTLPHLLPYATYTAHLLFCYLMLSALYTSPSAPSWYLHSTLLPHDTYILLCHLMLLNTVHLPFCSLILPTLYTFPSAPSRYLHNNSPSALSCYLHSTPSLLLPHAIYTTPPLLLPHTT
jgi:hypothetical protein